MLRSPTTRERETKRGVNKGRRAGVSARWKRMVTPKRPGEGFQGEWGVLDQLPSVLQTGEVDVHARRLLMVTSQERFDSDDCRKLFHIAFAL